MKPIRVRIEGSGPDPRRWRIVDAETGRPIEGVVSLTVHACATDGKAASAMLELCAFDYSMEVEATARRFGLEPAPRPAKVTL